MLFGKKYFKSHLEGDCYRSALCNILVELGDRRMAQQVFNTYLSHPLVMEDGGNFSGTATRILRDLTHDQYKGTLLLGFDHNFEDVIRESYGDLADKVIAVTKEEMDLGNLVKEGVEFFPPAICIVDPVYTLTVSRGKPHIVDQPPENNVNHALVALGGNKLIDNGYKISYPLEKLRVVGVMQVERNK